MAYGTFKSVSEVAKKFDIKVADKKAFVGSKKLEVLDVLLIMLEKKLKDDTNYVSEFSICDSIIRPILDIVAENYPLKVWSHVSYNVDQEKGLVGEPDYLIAGKTEYGAMARPVLCVIEAKKDNFDEGWAQALAEMVASSLQDATVCYAVVTTGLLWQFAKLDNGVFIKDPDIIFALNDLQGVFDAVSWVFEEVS